MCKLKSACCIRHHHLHQTPDIIHARNEHNSRTHRCFCAFVQTITGWFAGACPELRALCALCQSLVPGPPEPSVDMPWIITGFSQELHSFGMNFSRNVTSAGCAGQGAGYSHPPAELCQSPQGFFLYQIFQFCFRHCFPSYQILLCISIHVLVVGNVYKNSLQ